MNFISEYFDSFSNSNPVVFLVLMLVLTVWSIFWKGWSLWKASHNNQKYWFVALLVVNTLGILEILYIFVFSKKKAASNDLVPKPISEASGGKISFDKFRETDLRVATVKTAERVSGSDKLIKLDLDDGSGSRQIVAGIGKQYEPEKLINKQIVVVANLEPRKLMGLESQGMLLAATNSDGHPILVIPEEEVKAGTRLS